MFSNRSIEKGGDKVVIDNNSVYHRDLFVGVLHEQLLILVCAVPYYPVSKDTLYFDELKYPAKQIIESLRSKHGTHGEDKYVLPAQLHIDCLDEAKPRSLEELHNNLETLQRRADCRIFTPNWERDFARTKFNASCLDGDRAFFKTSATSALDEGRVQISATAKELLSRSADALICFGLCVVAAEKMNPYKGSQRSSDFSRREESLASSYS